MSFGVAHAFLYGVYTLYDESLAQVYTKNDQQPAYCLGIRGNQCSEGAFKQENMHLMFTSALTLLIISVGMTVVYYVGTCGRLRTNGISCK